MAITYGTVRYRTFPSPQKCLLDTKRPPGPGDRLPALPTRILKLVELMLLFTLPLTLGFNSQMSHPKFPHPQHTCAPLASTMVGLGASSLLLDLSELTYFPCHGCVYVVCVLGGGGGKYIFTGKCRQIPSNFTSVGPPLSTHGIISTPRLCSCCFLMPFIPPALVHGPALLYLPLRSPPAYSALPDIPIAFTPHPTRHSWLYARIRGIY